MCLEHSGCVAHLVSTVGKAVGAILQTVHTLGAGSCVDGTVVVPTLSTQSIGLGTILSVVVDDRLAGDVLGLNILLGRLGVSGVSSVAGVDKGFKTGTLARVRLHDLLVLVESLDHLFVADIVQEDALAKRGRNGGTELAITCLRSCISVWPRLIRSSMTYLQDSLCLLYTSPSPRDGLLSRMPSSA